MKIYTEFCKCSVCGGDALARLVDCVWYVQHVDPKVCTTNLIRKREELDRREKDLKDKYNGG